MLSNVISVVVYAYPVCSNKNCSILPGGNQATRCDKCKRMMLLKTCSTSVHADIKFENDKDSVRLSVFPNILEEVLNIKCSDVKGTQENLEIKLLLLSNVTIRYNSKI